MPIEADPAIPARRFLDIAFAVADFEEVLRWCACRPCAPGFRYVVTPNVDHIVRLFPKTFSPVTADFRNAYANATLRICDSRVLALLAKASGVDLPVVTGSDLTAALFSRVFTKGHRIAMIGGQPETCARLEQLYPGPNYCQHSPPFGLASNQAALDQAADFVSSSKADFVLFAVGAPQSEILAARCAMRGANRGLGLCIGASIDFILGDRPRAPHWVQRLNLEWAFRLGSEPRRLWRRYLVDGPRIFQLVRRWKAGRLEPLDPGG
jgi:N-acetylglucosaminyldiphosphoundecaprenol N-acetyl-beta-D-mannosaminyltransferase